MVKEETSGGQYCEIYTILFKYEVCQNMLTFKCKQTKTAMKTNSNQHLKYFISTFHFCIVLSNDSNGVYN